MRAFISIDIPENVRKDIEKVQSQLPEFSGKKTEQENLHLTLKFLGEVDEKKVEQVKEKLREIKLNKFKTEIDSIGVFSPKFIKIIWLHLSNCDKLQNEIDKKLESLFPKEKRFMSHLTIARVKSLKNKEIFIEELNKIKIPEISFTVKNFKLKQSILSKKAPVYKTIEEYNLF